VRFFDDDDFEAWSWLERHGHVSHLKCTQSNVSVRSICVESNSKSGLMIRVNDNVIANPISAP
jgi:hypothetical protein